MSARRLQPTRPRWTRHLAWGLSLVLASAGPAAATTFVPMSIEDLAGSSAAVFIGRVESVRGAEEPQGIVTYVGVRIERTLEGEAADTTITLREPGGRAGARSEIVYGAPTYSVGERIVVFVGVGADGVPHTSHLALGKFEIETGPGGELRATRRLGPGTSVLASPGVEPWRPSMSLDELIAAVHEASRTSGPKAPLGGGAYERAPLGEPTARFTLQGPNRYFELDEGATVSYLIDDRGDDIIGREASLQSIEDALQTWNDVENANVRIASAGTTSDLSLPCEEGLHRIRFNDPDNMIDDPVNCTGVLGIGGQCAGDDEKFFNGATFRRTLRGFATFADGWEGCPIWTPCNVAEVAVHEIGHSLGLGHSSENPNEADGVLRDATMFFQTHGDGRCAAVRSDDVEAITFVYPNALPPTITTPSPLPEAVFNQPYRVQLEATGGAGSFEWSLVVRGDGFDCPPLDTFSLSPGGVIEGMSPFGGGEGCFLVKATDASGDSHTKRLFVPFVATASTPTATPTEAAVTPTVTPMSTPTATRTLAPVDCSGDCDGDGSVSVAEVVLATNIALGSASLEDCTDLDFDSDGTITIDELIRAVMGSLAGCLG